MSKSLSQNLSYSVEIDFRSRHALVHYGEIALKGKNRKFFETALVDSLKVGLAGVKLSGVRRLYGRILVSFADEVELAQIQEPLSAIHGVSHFELAQRTSLELETIEALIGEAIEGLEVESFAIRTKRANKAFPLNSVEVNRAVGDFVVQKKAWKVNIDHPQLPIYIYLLDRFAYVAFDRLQGAGGMPVGVAGKVVCLLSGGIDSPVAANRLMRRGCEPVFVHFHSAPYTSQESQEKVKDLVRRLLRFQRPSRLYLVPFAGLQQKIVAETPAPLRVILYRRFMLRIAEAIARHEGALALVTGECLGQVASQTLENLQTIDAAVSAPVLRPLIGFDKVEIVREAERLGTFETSIEPHEDCCAFLMPSHPATYSSKEELEGAEEVFDVPSEVTTLVESAQVVEVGG